MTPGLKMTKKTKYISMLDTFATNDAMCEVSNEKFNFKVSNYDY